MTTLDEHKALGREIENMRKTMWNLFRWACGIFGFLFLLSMGANSSQNSKIDGKVDNRPFIEYKTENNKDHERIRGAVSENTKALNDLRVTVESGFSRLETILEERDR